MSNHQYYGGNAPPGRGGGGYGAPPNQNYDYGNGYGGAGGYPPQNRGPPLGNPYDQRGAYNAPYDQARHAPQVIDYAAQQARSGYNPPPQGAYRDDLPPTSASQPPSLTPSFAGALSKISLDDLKNTLGGQLGNLLNKGLSQQPSYDEPSQRQPDDRYSRPPMRDDPYSRGASSDRYSDQPLLREPPTARRSPVARGYDIDPRDRPYGGGDGGNPLLNLPSHRHDIAGGRDYLDTQRKPLFPIASDTSIASSVAEPKSILKKSILKKSKADEEPLRTKPLQTDVVDEDDFLYGGAGEEKEKPSREPEPTSKPKSAQEIVSNPAFTALLKKIGLDDLKLAERIKERQGGDQPPPQAVKPRERKMSESEQFGIDQNASFLSSGVVLDDLLKLKQPTSGGKEPTTKSEQSKKPRNQDDIPKQYREEEQREDRSDARESRSDSRDDRSDRRTDDRRKDGGRGDRDERRRDDRDDRNRRDRDRNDEKRSSRRSPSPKRRSRSPAKRNRSRSTSRDRRREGRTKSDNLGSDKSSKDKGRRDRSRSPKKSPSPKRSSRDTSKAKDEDNKDAPPVKKNRWSAVTASPSDEASSKKQEVPVESQRKAKDDISKRRSVEDSHTQKSPQAKPSKPAGEGDFMSFMSKIPSDMKLTRAQFEELLRTHQSAVSKRETSPTPSSTSSKDSKSRGKRRSRSPERTSVLRTRDASPEVRRVMKRPASKSPEMSRDAFLASISRRSVKKEPDDDDFKKLTLLVRTDNSKKAIVTDDDLLDIKPKRQSKSPSVKRERTPEQPNEGRRVVRRIGAMGSTAEKQVLESEKDKFLKEFEETEMKKAFGSEPLLPRLTPIERRNISQLVEFNKDKLTKCEKQLLMLQDNQGEVMRNMRHASVGEQYHLDKTLSNNIRLQNEITVEIKELKKVIRDDELALDEQGEQERKIRDIQRRKIAASKSYDSNIKSNKKEPTPRASPPPEKMDRKYRRAIEDQLMGKTKPPASKSSDSEAKSSDSKSTSGGGGGLSKAGTTKVEYYDPGTHWCKTCNFVAFKLYGYLEHLQTSSHIKRREKIGKPWQADIVKNPPRKSLISRQETIVQPIKGIEFIHPVDSYYCTICNWFTGDKDSVEHHLKTAEHHSQYQAYISDNPMYERRYKNDKEQGLQEAKKLEEKRKEEQERKLEAEREDEERRREADKRKDREKREEEYKRKNEKILKLQAKKKAEVLAITRGDEDSDDDVEFVDDVGEAIKGKVVTPISTSKLVETAQERIKRELLEKTRAKKAGAGGEVGKPDPGSLESAPQRAARLAAAKKQVKAKAAEIEEAVYGPKIPPSSSSGGTPTTPDSGGAFNPPGIFLPDDVIQKSKEKQAETTIPVPSSVPHMDLSIPPPVSGSSRGGSGGKGEAISPFVQKMMAMEKSGEMITTKSIQQHAMSAPPPSRFNMMPPGVMMGPGAGLMGPPPMGPGGPMIRGPGMGPMMGPPGMRPPMVGGPMMGPMMGPGGPMMGPGGPMMGPGGPMMGPPGMMGGPMFGPGGPMMDMRDIDIRPPGIITAAVTTASMTPPTAASTAGSTAVTSAAAESKTEDDDTDSSSSTSSSEDDEEGDNSKKNNGGHSFSLASLMSQINNSGDKSSPTSNNKPASSPKSAAALSPAAGSGKRVTRSSAKATPSSPAKLAADSTTGVATESAAAAGTAGVDDSEGDGESIEDMEFTVLDSVGE